MQPMQLVHAALLLALLLPWPSDASLLHHSTHLHRGLLEVCPAHLTLGECMEQQGLDEEAAAATMHAEQHQHPPHAPEQEQDACSLHAVLNSAAAGLDEAAAAAADDAPDGPETLEARSARILIGLLLLTTLLGLGLAYFRIDSAPRWLSRRMVKALNVEALAEQHLAGSDVGLSKLLTYMLDKHLSSTPSFKIWILAIVTGALIVFGGLALFAAGEDSLYSAFWLAVAGAGLDWTFSDKAHGANWAALIMRTVSLLLSVGGMLVTALLLGLVSDAISSKVDDLRKGKAPVLESDHTLIIGFSEKVFCLIQELAMGKASVGGRPIVILAEKDKEAMEDAIGAHNIELYGSSISCRTGDPLMRSELLKVSAQFASSIIILANDSHPQQSDASLIRVVLSLMVIHMELHSCGRGGLKGHIVAEACNRDHRDLLLHLGYAQLLHTVVPHDLSARMMVQCARHPQVLAALTELTGFAGSEFHVDPRPPSKLEGLSFQQLQKLYPAAVPVGIKKANGDVLLRPSAQEPFEKGDSMILIADDETSLRPDASKLNAAAAELYLASHGDGPDEDLLGRRHDDSIGSLTGSRGQMLNSFLLGRRRVPSMLSGAGRTAPAGDSFGGELPAPVPDSLHGRLREIAGMTRANLAHGAAPGAAPAPGGYDAAGPPPGSRQRLAQHAGAMGFQRNRTEEFEKDLRGQLDDEEAQEDLPWWDRVYIPPQPQHQAGAEYPGLERHSGWTQGAETESMAEGSAAHQSVLSASHFGGRFLVCGWRRDMAGLIRVFDEICTFKSELWLFSSVSVEVRSKLLEQGGLTLDDKGFNHELKQLRIVFKERQLEGNLVSKWHMKLLDPLQFRAVLILADDPASANLASMGSQIKGLLTAVLAANSSFDTSTPMTAVDSQSLTTLLLLRQTQLEQLHEEHEAEAAREAKLPKSASLPDKLPLMQHLQQRDSMRRSAQQPGGFRQAYKPPRSLAAPTLPLSTPQSERADPSTSPPGRPGRQAAGYEHPTRSLLDDATAAAVQALLGEEGSDPSLAPAVPEEDEMEPSLFDGMDDDEVAPDVRRRQAASLLALPSAVVRSAAGMASTASTYPGTATYPGPSIPHGPPSYPPSHVWPNGYHPVSSSSRPPAYSSPPLSSPDRNGRSHGLDNGFAGSLGFEQQGTRTYTSPVFDAEEELSDQEADGGAAGAAAHSPMKPMAAAMSAAAASRSPTRARTSQSFLEQWRQRVLCSDVVQQPATSPAAGPTASAPLGKPGVESDGLPAAREPPPGGDEGISTNGKLVGKISSMDVNEQLPLRDSWDPPPLAVDSMKRRDASAGELGARGLSGLSPPQGSARPSSPLRELGSAPPAQTSAQPPLLSPHGMLEQFRMLPTAPWGSGGGAGARYPEDAPPAGVSRVPPAAAPGQQQGTESRGADVALLQGASAASLERPVGSSRGQQQLGREGVGSGEWAGTCGWDPMDSGEVGVRKGPEAGVARASSGRARAAAPEAPSSASARQLSRGMSEPLTGSGRVYGNMGEGGHVAAPLVKTPSYKEREREREVKRQGSQHHDGGGGGMDLFSAFTDAQLESVVEGASEEGSSCDSEDGSCDDSSCSSGVLGAAFNRDEQAAAAAKVSSSGAACVEPAGGDEQPRGSAGYDDPPLLGGASGISIDRSFSRPQPQSHRHPASRPGRHSHSHHSHHGRKHLVSNQWPKELRQVVKQSTIVTEMLDSKSLALVKEMHISKYIMSNDMTAQLLALISCCPERADIYHELLWPGGTSLSVRPVGTLLSKIERINFFEASERLMHASGDVLVGYIEQLGQKTTINPADKAANFISCTTVDALIILVRGSDENDAS